MITKPILAANFDPSKAQFPYIAMPKIDGVRGLHLTPYRGFTGRSLKRFANKLVYQRFSNLPLGLDGELSYGSVTDPTLCRTVTSVVSKFEDTRALTLVLNVFDYITPETEHLTYSDRLLELRKLNLPVSCKLVPYQLVTSLDDLATLEEQYLSEGYEGVILRDPNGTYKNGRTTVNENNYLRIKRFIQEDAQVMSIVEAMENTNPKVTNELGQSERSSHQANLVPKGMIGSLICRDIKTNQTITVGPGEMTHEERVLYFNHPEQILGHIISYKSFKHGVKDKPRFPTFVTIRDISDLVKE